MKLVSNSLSIKKGEISVLALIETLAASIVFFFSLIKLHAYLYAVFTACLPAVLLLRTDRSAARAIVIRRRFGFNKITLPSQSKLRPKDIV